MANKNIKYKGMTAIQLRAELFREMSPLLDNETAMEKILTYVRTLLPSKNLKDNTDIRKTYKTIPVSDEIKKWSGCVSFTEAEIESDPRLQILLNR